MKMCSAFARAGHDVTLTTKANPGREEPGVEDPFAFYGVGKDFELRKLARPSGRGGGLLHLWRSRRFLAGSEPPPDLVYSRDLAAAAFATDGAQLIFEAHGPPTRGLSRFLYRRLLAAPNLRRLIVISKRLEELMIESGLVPRGLDVLVAHDAADPLAPAAPDAALPASLTSAGVTHAGYVGHLYGGRGIGLLARLAERLPSHHFHLVGGSPADLTRWRAASTSANLHFHGFVPPSRLSAYYNAFDVLLAPYQDRVLVASGKTDTSGWMSPLKIFEYMAAGKPIVSSDLPVLREILRHEDNALLTPADSVEDWSQALGRLSSDRDLAEKLADRARLDFERNHSWDVRASRVLARL